MQNLFTLLGEAKAVIRMEAGSHQPGPQTAHAYLTFYQSFRSGRAVGPARTRSTAVWRKAAVRYGVIAGLRADREVLERALASGDLGAAQAVAGAVREAVDLLYEHQAGRPGRRARGAGAPQGNAPFAASGT